MIGPVRHSLRPLRVSSLGSPHLYAEVSIAFTDVAKLDAALAPLELVHCELPYAAGFLAEKAFLSIGVVRVVSTLLCLTFISVHMQR